jgi:hypothetical protein
MSRAQERKNQEQVESGEAGQAEQQPEENQTFQAVDAGDQDGEVKDYQPNDAEGDRVSAHGNASEEELEAQRLAVTGYGRAVDDKGPSQDDLNPAYSTERIFDEDAAKEKESSDKE